MFHEERDVTIELVIHGINGKINDLYRLFFIK